MPARNTSSKARAKERRQKQIAIVGGVILVALLAIQGPKTLALLRGSSGGSAAPAPTTTAPAAPGAATRAPLAAPTLSGGSSAPAAAPGQPLVASVHPTPDPGQLQDLARFASKDPFAAQVTTSGAPSPAPPKKPSAAGGKRGSATAPTTTTTPATLPATTLPTVPLPAPTTTAPAATAPAPPPTSAVISVNDEPENVAVDGDFPTAGTVFDQVGSLFHLVSLTQDTATVSIVGGSYADGSSTLTLEVGKPVTLENTADGSRYTLRLYPQGTLIATGTAPDGTTTTTATTAASATTPASTPAATVPAAPPSPAPGSQAPATSTLPAAPLVPAGG